MLPRSHNCICCICETGRANVVPPPPEVLMADETTGVLMAPALHRASPGLRSQGLYDPRNEHDGCGVGFVADLTGDRRHETVGQALTVLRNLDHRGAKGADPETGDGA